MIDTNPIHQVCNYGSSASYCSCPTPEQIATGVIPLDSLPAAWWNWMWNDTNKAVNEARYAASVLIDEIDTVLQQACVCPNCVCTDQLYQAIEKIRQTIGNAVTAGAVKSSSCPSEIAIDACGIMSVNCLGNAASLTTVARTVVGAINELKSTYDCCFTDTATAIGGKAPTNHASALTTYGVANSTCYGHVMLSDTYTSDLCCAGMAASQTALACVYAIASSTGNAVEWTDQVTISDGHPYLISMATGCKVKPSYYWSITSACELRSNPLGQAEIGECNRICAVSGKAGYAHICNTYSDEYSVGSAIQYTARGIRVVQRTDDSTSMCVDFVPIHAGSATGCSVVCTYTHNGTVNMCVWACNLGLYMCCGCDTRGYPSMYYSLNGGTFILKKMATCSYPNCCTTYCIRNCTNDTICIQLCSACTTGCATNRVSCNSYFELEPGCCCMLARFRACTAATVDTQLGYRVSSTKYNTQCAGYCLFPIACQNWQM